MLRRRGRRRAGDRGPWAPAPALIKVGPGFEQMSSFSYCLNHPLHSFLERFWPSFLLIKSCVFCMENGKSVLLFFLVLTLEVNADPSNLHCFDCIYPAEEDHISAEEAESIFAQLRVNCEGFAPAISLEWKTAGSSVSIPINDTVDEHVEIHTRVKYRGVQLWELKITRSDGSAENMNRTFHFLTLYSPKIEVSFPFKEGFTFKRGVPPFIVAEVDEEDTTIDSHGYPFFFLDIILDGPELKTSNSSDPSQIISSRRQRHPPYLTPMPRVTMLFLNGLREEENPADGKYTIRVDLMDGSGQRVGASVYRDIRIDYTRDYTPTESRRNVAACAKLEAAVEPGPSIEDEQNCTADTISTDNSGHCQVMRSSSMHSKPSRCTCNGPRLTVQWGLDGSQLRALDDGRRRVHAGGGPARCPVALRVRRSLEVAQGECRRGRL
jgi:hypothetical protein